MSLPKAGDVIAIRWPGGPHDFVMEFLRLDERMPQAALGWLWLHGVVGETRTRYLSFKDCRTLYARWTGDGEYEMVGRPDGQEHVRA